MRRGTTYVGVLVIAALLVGVVGWLFSYDPPYRGSLQATGRPLVFGHRGFGNYAPDNSLAGAKLSMAAKVDGVDMDGQITADGALVIFHDLSVDRLTEGPARVAAHSLADLRRLDLGVKYGKGFEGKPDSFVATFEDFRHDAGEGHPHGGAEGPGAPADGDRRGAVDLVRKHAAFEDVFLSSFNPVVLYRLKKIEPRIHTVFIFMDTNWNPELLAEIKPGDLVNLPFFLRSELFRRAIRKLVQPDALSVNITVDEETTRALLEKGQPIFLWTPEKREAIEKALRLKPFGVISDEPTMAKEIRDKLYPG